MAALSEPAVTTEDVQRGRWLGIAAALAATLLLWLPKPNLRLLIQPATPTSYQRSETGFTAASIRAGEDLVRAHCVPECFRAYDDPSDLSPYDVWSRPDGDFFWWLGTTFDTIGHSPFPHGTIAGLPPGDRWRLIDYFRARAAGTIAARHGTWPYPVRPPEITLDCAGHPTRLSELRGRVVHLVAIADGTEALPPDVPVTPVVLARAARLAVPPDACIAGGPDAWDAFALIAGVEPAALDGTRFLIDANGWLRSLIPPGTACETWREEVRRIQADPFAAADVGTHLH